MMPDLPNVGVERDMESFREFFESPLFRADGLKIYPTLVIRGTGLYELWKTGRYRNYPPEQLVDIIARILAMVPPWTCVYRVQRDIPTPLVTSGVEKGNLRELALARMEDLGLKCRDVRTREAGIQDIHHQIRPEEVELVRHDYMANEGWEPFYHMKIHGRYSPGEFPMPSETQSAEFYKMASRMLSDASYHHYEISSYCKSGYECKHNSIYWKNKPFYGFGLGSEFRSILHANSLKFLQDRRRFKGNPRPFMYEDESPPSSLDWREKCAVAHVKNQGNNCAIVAVE